MTPSPDPKPVFTALTALIEAFTKLDPLLSYGGLILVGATLLAWLTGQLPDWLLAVPLVVIGAFLLYSYLDRRAETEKIRLQQEAEREKLRLQHEAELEKARLNQELEKQRLEIERLKVEQKGKLEQTRQEQKGNPPPPKPVAPDPEPSPATWPQSYYRAVWQKCLQMQMTGIDPKAQELGAAVFQLHKIFTSLDVPAGTPHLPAKTQPDPEQQRRPVLTAISQEKYLVLLGQPGSGKSTLVNYLTLGLSGEHLAEAETNLAMLIEQGWKLTALLPIRVILRDYAAKGLPSKQSLWQFMAANLSQEKLGNCQNSLENHLKQSGGLLLLDGLDEVPEANHRPEQLRQAILDFVRDFPQVRVVVTSRPYAYQSQARRLPKFSQTTLLDFTPEQVESYIERWYGAAAPQDPNLSGGRADQYASQLKQQVKYNPNLRELASRPLLLALMVSLHRWRGGGLLPERREQLYHHSVELLLELWQKPKVIWDADGRPQSEEGNTLTELGLDTQTVRQALSRLAFQVHRDQAEGATGTADIAHEKLVAALRQALPKERRDLIPHAKIARYVRDRAGLLEDRGEGVYGFPHRTFQEYLAAMHLLDQPDFPTELVRLVRQDPARWREATLLAGNTAQTALQWSLVEALYGRQEVPQQGNIRDDQWWGAFLSGRVIHDAELLPKTDPLHQPSLAQVKRWQVAILQQGALPPRDRALAGDVLAELGDDRPGVLNWEEMPLCYVPPGEFWLADGQRSQQGQWLGFLNQAYWLGQYPVTVAQFGAFVRDSAYRPTYGDRPLAAPANRPVVLINWYDSLAFCDWLTKRWQKWLPAGYRVTLPNEPEWEKGARGGRQIPLEPQIMTVRQLKATLANPPTVRANPLPQREYPWGNQPSQEQVAGKQNIYRANDEPAGINNTSAVGAFPAGASPHGCLDMAGNAWEWSRSFYNKPRPYRLSPEYEATDSKNENAVWLCGGSYYVNYIGCSARDRLSPDYCYSNAGLRVAVSPFCL